MSEEIIIHIDGLNATPWTSPTASTGRVGGKVRPMLHKNAELRTYQEAIKENLATRYNQPLIITPIRLEFYFWRAIEKYTNAGGKLVRKHRADATNLQKALEDALQGIVYKNDNQVRSVHSTIVEEADEVDPYIVVVVKVDEDDIEDARSKGESYRARR